MVQELTWFAQHVREQDTFILYYAGHGVPSHIAHKQTLWLLHTTGMETLEPEGLRLTHLLDYIHDIRAKQKLLILDHCLAGKIRLLLAESDGTAAAEALVIEDAQLSEVDDLGNEIGAVRLIRDDGLIVLGASSSQAREAPERAHGVFTAIVLDALRNDCEGVAGNDCADKNNDSRVTVSEMASYVDGRLEAGQTQRPFSHPNPVTGNWNLLQLTRTVTQRARVEARFRLLVDTLESQNAISGATRQHCDGAISRWRNQLDQLAPTARLELSNDDEEIIHTLSGLTELTNDEMTQPSIAWSEMGKAIDAAVARGGGLP